MSRRRGGRIRWAELVLFVIVVGLGTALYDTSGAGPVVLAVVIAAILGAFANSRPKRRGRSRRR